MLWFVSPSVLSLASVTPKATNNPLNEVQRVVQQLLGVSHLRVSVGSDVQKVDLEQVYVIAILLREQVPEFTVGSDGLNLLLQQRPVRSSPVITE